MFSKTLEIEDIKDLEEIYKRLYIHFKEDFIDNKTYLNNDIYIDPQSQRKKEGKENIFWHIITKENKQIKKREFDIERGKRIKWIKPIIVNYSLKEIKLFYHYEKDKKIRLYLWLEEKDFIVILQKLGKKSSYLVTSFYIDKHYNRRVYEKRHEAYKNKKHPKLVGCEWF